MLAYLLFCRGFSFDFCLKICEIRVIRGVKIGKISTFFQPKTLIPQNKNQISQNFFNCLAGIELRESQIDIRGLFSHQKCR